MSYGRTDEQTGAGESAASAGGPVGNVAEVPPSGPLCLTGRIQVEVDGEIVADTDDVALCRCGHSSNKPFCDGSHNKVGFADPGVILGGRLVPGGAAGEEGGWGCAGRRAGRDRLCEKRPAVGAGAAHGGGVGRGHFPRDERRAVPVRGVVDEAVLRRIAPRNGV